MAVSVQQLSKQFSETDVARRVESARPFAAAFIGFCLISAALITWRPIQLSIATVFLFAGPHNWIEFRFFLGRMPLKWGSAKRFYTLALAGVGVLTAAYIALYSAGGLWYLSQATWTVSTALWNSAIILWIAGLIYMRGRERGRDRSWIFAAAFGLCSVVWLAPFWFSLGLVYLHPLVALWFLDRELKRSRPRWRPAYHGCLAVLAAVVVLMGTALGSSANLPDGDALSWRITQHAGAGYLTGISSHLLVSTHVLLETVHYGAWLVLIPLVGMKSRPWKLNRVPLASSAKGWPRAAAAVLIAGLFVVAALWASFGVSYVATRDIYFTMAIAHVLAEAPFLIRMS